MTSIISLFQLYCGCVTSQFMLLIPVHYYESKDLLCYKNCKSMAESDIHYYRYHAFSGTLGPAYLEAT
jgi:hypothetical protein